MSEVDPEELYAPGEVAQMFHVDPKTVVRWIKANKFAGQYIKTPGGHHRIRGAGILTYLLTDEQIEEPLTPEETARMMEAAGG